MTEQTPNPSTLLKDTREAKGLTLEIVHEATKVPLDALKAIEQGYSVRVLTPFYHRGFIKIYAGFLGLDARDVFKSYNLEAGQRTVPADKGRPVTVPGNFSGVAHKPRVRQPNHLLDQAQEFWGGLWTAKNRKWLLRVAAFTAALFVLVKCAGCVAAHIKNKNKPRTKSAPVVLKIKESKPLVLAPKQEPTIVTAANHKVELAVRALKDSWIQVKTDGKVAFAMTMQKGTMESWNAREQIELSGKNINALDLEINGKHIGSLGSAERRAKRVVITKDGLTVKK